MEGAASAKSDVANCSKMIKHLAQLVMESTLQSLAQTEIYSKDILTKIAL